MSALHLQRAVIINGNHSSSHRSVLVAPSRPLPIVRYAYYAFIFSIPFEGVDIGITSETFTLSKIVGYIFVAVALLQPHLAFRRPPKAFWYFVIYICTFAMFGILQEPVYYALFMPQLISQVQMVILFWISYNLMQYERVIKGTLLMLAVAIISLAVLQMFGLIGTTWGRFARSGALRMDPNSFAAVLSLGLLALIGLAYGRQEIGKKIHLLFWPACGVLAITIVSTASRGSMAALTVALLTFLLKDRSIRSKLKVGVTVLLALGLLVWLSYRSETFRLRWEKTFVEGSLGGREEIYPEVWRKFLEKPLTGWGPIQISGALSAPHNLYLEVLIQLGLVGAIPFFMGMWFCLRAAWKARNGMESVVPLAMLTCLFLVNMSITWHNRKLHWIVLAYALASATRVVFPRLRISVPRPYRLVRS